MLFLLRVTFWLTVVLALLPYGSTRPIASSGPQVGAADAVVAASAAVSDVSGFCNRQPGACAVGASAAVAIGQRAQAGAKMVYEFINDRMTGGETGSQPPRQRHSDGPNLPVTVRTIPIDPDSQTTLKTSDLEPEWQGPSPRIEAVPVPLPRPRMEHVPLPRPRLARRQAI
jgi:hypothetical protein